MAQLEHNQRAQLCQKMMLNFVGFQAQRAYLRSEDAQHKY